MRSLDEALHHRAMVQRLYAVKGAAEPTCESAVELRQRGRRLRPRVVWTNVHWRKPGHGDSGRSRT
ncbi:MAG: hypothetical protein D6826_12040 [Alphaproteobacteria bacterium]|nr:MAG: hypothetical protein D6826_12040 [Alphaproteobacteria bacterium]